MCLIIVVLLCVTTNSYDRMYFVIADDEDESVKERDQLRYDRHKERERSRRIARAHPEKRCII